MSTAQVVTIVIIALPLLLALTECIAIDTAAFSIAVLLGIAHFGGLGILGEANTPNNAIRAFAGFSRSAVFILIALSVIISGLLPLAKPPQPSLHVLDFAGTGSLILIAGLIYMAIFASRLLPNREEGTVFGAALSESPNETGENAEKAAHRRRFALRAVAITGGGNLRFGGRCANLFGNVQRGGAHFCVRG
ncbi:MAG TPA: hypothetical protein PLD47_18645 [Aggregatilineales bacterium]|nr:hypothetical protein [Anaerolineales bacterium]HRE49749.1 hypothetical protein [Aggregatilineales bacterium]